MLLSLSLCWYSVLEGLGCNVLPELQALLKTHMCLVQETSRRTVAACLISAGFFSLPPPPLFFSFFVRGLMQRAPHMSDLPS